MLASCRQSCREDCKTRELNSLQQQFLAEMGGLGDDVVDMFGNSLPICDLRKASLSVV